MKYLFSHRNFPAQFRHILIELSKNPENEIVFLTGTKNDFNIKGVRKVDYSLKRKVPDDCHSYLRDYEEAIIHGQAAAEALIRLRNSGFTPDVIYSHAWGNSMFFKDIYPNVPLINFCEWYFNAENSDVDFLNKNVDENKRAFVRIKNSQILMDLISCDKGICPTAWQKSQFPKEFQNKLIQIHDGIDTDYFRPDENVIFRCDGLEFTRKDKVVTYATRGMEPYRGFPQFMEMAERLLKARPDVHVVIAGEDRVCYGTKLANTTYKKLMLDKLDLDMSRVHFTGGLPYVEYKKLLQVSSAHVYLTFPFVLSWSMLEAMACGCCIIGSNTAPVKEVIVDGENGYLVEFLNISQILDKVCYVLDNPNKTVLIRENARQTIIDRYKLSNLLPKILTVLSDAAQKKF